jgi:hypothetical protein
VLARFRWKAAIYIPTAAIGTPGRLSWAQLREMQASGRWRADEHAGEGHVLVTVPRDVAVSRLATLQHCGTVGIPS